MTASSCSFSTGWDSGPSDATGAGARINSTGSEKSSSSCGGERSSCMYRDCGPRVCVCVDPPAEEEMDVVEERRWIACRVIEG